MLPQSNTQMLAEAWAFAANEPSSSSANCGEVVSISQPLSSV